MFMTQLSEGQSAREQLERVTISTMKNHSLRRPLENWKNTTEVRSYLKTLICYFRNGNKQQTADPKNQFLRPWQTRTHCCGHIVARDVSWAAQTRGSQNECCVSMLRKLGNICCGHKMFLNKSETVFVSRTQNLCPQQMLHARANGETVVSQCVRNKVSSFARASTRCPDLSNQIREIFAVRFADG